MSPPQPEPPPVPDGFPRVSGDEPLRQVKVVCHLEFSPRERG